MIDNKVKSYRLKIGENYYTFMPMDLFSDESFLPLKAQVHKSKGYLFWNVKGKQITYNKIKNLIYEKSNL